MEAYRSRSAKNAKAHKKHALIGWLFSIAVAVAVAAVIFGFWLTPLVIYGDSMAPALTEGQIVLVDRLGKYFSEPKRGDVILFSGHNGELALKRILGLPGETVELAGGTVFINSRPLAENGYAVSPGEDARPLRVPDGEVYVLGDNRRVLYDSRTEAVGCIPYDEIRGVLRFRIYPAGELRFYY